MPPAFLLSVQIFSPIVFGYIGVIFSTPLLGVAIVLIETLYVQGMLGEKIAVLGEKEKKPVV